MDNLLIISTVNVFCNSFSSSLQSACTFSTGTFLLIATLCATFLFAYYGLGMSNDTIQRTYVLPKLYTRKNDISKRWFVRFQAWNIATQKLELKTVFCPAKFKTAKERKIWADTEIKEITKLLQSGFVFGNVELEQNNESKPFITEIQNILNISVSSLAPKTVISYQSSINKFVDFLTEKNSLEIQEISKTMVFDFRDFLIVKKANTPRTVNNTIDNIKCLFARIMERSNINENPFTVKKLRSQPTQKNLAFTDSDKNIIENYLRVNEPELFLFTRFLYFGFIRPGELQKLRWLDISKDQKYITVRGIVSKNNKTDTVPIIPPLKEFLTNSHFKGIGEKELIFGKGLVPGLMVSAKQVAFRRHQKALQNTGLLEKGYTLYSWKHTGVVNAYLSGVGVKQLQNMLRHSSILITDIYLKSLGLRVDKELNNYNW